MRSHDDNASPTSFVIQSGDDAGAIQRAAACLQRGELVAFPTETVYGLGADATSGEAVARIYETKARPQSNPLIIHVARMEDAQRIARFSALATSLAGHFWPGPLTLVLPRATDCPVSLLTTAGLDTVALRMPAHPVAQRLLAATKLPLAAPSANPSGRVSPTRATDVVSDFGAKVKLVLDGGPCEHGLESTVLSLVEDRDGVPAPRVLRPGAITPAQIQELLNPHNLQLLSAPTTPADAPKGAALPSPGMLRSHYAPAHPLRLDAESVRADEALLAFGPNPPPGAATMANLSERGDLREAAANLYAHLRTLDGALVRTIAVMPIPGEGLAEAIRDRLHRAAAPRGDGESP